MTNEDLAALRKFRKSKTNVRVSLIICIGADDFLSDVTLFKDVVLRAYFYFIFNIVIEAIIFRSLYVTLLHSTALFSNVMDCTTLDSILLYSTLLNRTLLSYTKYCTLLYRTLLHFTMLYSFHSRILYTV